MAEPVTPEMASDSFSQFVKENIQSQAGTRARFLESGKDSSQSLAAAATRSDTRFPGASDGTTESLDLRHFVALAS